MPGSILIAGVLIVGFCCIVHFFTPKLDPREPPLISPKIPLIGHVIGILRHGLPYYAKARYHATLKNLWLANRIDISQCRPSISCLYPRLVVYQIIRSQFSKTSFRGSTQPQKRVI